MSDFFKEMRIRLHSFLGHKFILYEYWHRLDECVQTERKAIMCSCGKTIWESPTGGLK